MSVRAGFRHHAMRVRASRFGTNPTLSAIQKPNKKRANCSLGWTTNGGMFDSSLMRGQPATFRLNEVIKWWTEGVQLMVEGEKRASGFLRGSRTRSAAGRRAC